MHRILQMSKAGDAQVALRSDASIWLIASEGGHVSLDRGNGWQPATRVRLCAGDRLRIGMTEVAAEALCQELGIEIRTPGNESARDGGQAKAPVPLSPPASFIQNARRNPGTGQIEPGAGD